MYKFLVLFSIFLSTFSFAQDDVKNAFDFWVGEWDAYWKPNDSTVVRGSNTISRTCDGSVIYENFADTTNDFFGNSISVWSPVDSLWHQAWADNQGGFLNLVGVIDGDRRIFQSEPVAINDKTVIRRMVFYEIKEESFKWDWEVSVDGGETWNLRWQILYTRKK